MLMHVPCLSQPPPLSPLRGLCWYIRHGGGGMVPRGMGARERGPVKRIGRGASERPWTEP